MPVKLIIFNTIKFFIKSHWDWSDPSTELDSQNSWAFAFLVVLVTTCSVGIIINGYLNTQPTPLHCDSGRSGAPVLRLGREENDGLLGRRMQIPQRTKRMAGKAKIASGPVGSNTTLAHCCGKEKTEKRKNIRVLASTQHVHSIWSLQILAQDNIPD